MGNNNSCSRGTPATVNQSARPLPKEELQQPSQATESNILVQDSLITDEAVLPKLASNNKSLLQGDDHGGSHHHVRTPSAFALSEEAVKSCRQLNDKSLSQASERLSRVQSREDLKHDYHAREVAAAAFKRDMAADWLPEYRPVSIVPPERTPDTVLERTVRISPAQILQVMKAPGACISI